MEKSKELQCRVCLSEDDAENLTDLFTKMPSIQKTIAEKIVYCTAVQVTRDDSLPSMICRECELYLNTSYVFKVICEWSNSKLREEKFSRNVNLDSADLHELLEEYSINERYRSAIENILDEEYNNDDNGNRTDHNVTEVIDITNDEGCVAYEEVISSEMQEESFHVTGDDEGGGQHVLEDSPIVINENGSEKDCGAEDNEQAADCELPPIGVAEVTLTYNNDYEQCLDAHTIYRKLSLKRNQSSDGNEGHKRLKSVSLDVFENFEKQVNKEDVGGNPKKNNRATRSSNTRSKSRVGRHIARKKAGQRPKRYAPTLHGGHLEALNKNATQQETAATIALNGELPQEYILESDLPTTLEETVITDSFYYVADNGGQKQLPVKKSSTYRKGATTKRGKGKKPTTSSGVKNKKSKVTKQKPKAVKSKVKKTASPRKNANKSTNPKKSRSPKKSTGPGKSSSSKNRKSRGKPKKVTKVTAKVVNKTNNRKGQKKGSRKGKKVTSSKADKKEKKTPPTPEEIQEIILKYKKIIQERFERGEYLPEDKIRKKNLSLSKTEMKNQEKSSKIEMQNQENSSKTEIQNQEDSPKTEMKNQEKSPKAEIKNQEKSSKAEMKNQEKSSKIEIKNQESPSKAEMKNQDKSSKIEIKNQEDSSKIEVKKQEKPRKMEMNETSKTTKPKQEQEIPMEIEHNSTTPEINGETTNTTPERSEKTDSSNVTCEVCRKKFPFPSHLERHMSSHSGIKRHTCKYCDKQFLHSYNLSLHMRSHTGNFPLRCKVCSRGFTSPSVLERHQRVHTGETPYQCRYCNQTFSHSTSLTMHEKMHLNRPSYSCDVCFKVFSYKNSLTAHMKGHSGSLKTHSCNICQKKFIRSTDVIKHMLNHSELKQFRSKNPQVFNKKSMLLKKKVKK